MPAGTLQGAHFVQTPHYVQITGRGDFTKLMLNKGDEGGELGQLPSPSSDHPQCRVLHC